MDKECGGFDACFKSLPKNVDTVSLTIKELNKMNLELLEAIQMRYPHAELVLVDLEGTQNIIEVYFGW